MPEAIQQPTPKQAQNSPLPEGWQRVKLNEVCELNPRRPVISRSDDAPTTFVPMTAVAASGAGIARPELRPFREIHKGYTYFAEGDVLFAKITPCMQNGKHAVAKDLTDGIGFGSTEFHVLRPGQRIIAEWIHAFLIQPPLLTEAQAFFTGAVGQQRVPADYLAELEIQLPPIPEQRRIATRLREQLAEVAQARTAIAAQLDATHLLPAAHLRAVFDSLSARRWPRRRLGDLLQLRKEVVHPCDNPRGPAVFVGLEHIESLTGRRLGSIQVEMSELTGRKPRFYSGDIVYGYLRPYLNKLWVAEFDGLCSVDQYVYSVDRQQAETDFVAWFMRSPVYLERAPIDTTPGQLPRIRTEEVASVEINLPPRAQQQTVVGKIQNEIAEATCMKEALAARLTAIEGMPASLLREAFSGRV